MTSPARIDQMRRLAEMLLDTRMEISSAATMVGLPEGWLPQQEDIHAQITFDTITRRCLQCEKWCDGPSVIEGQCDICAKAGDHIYDLEELDL